MDEWHPPVEELIPCPDPWAVARQLSHLPHLLFLDSAERHPRRGRYSYVAASPSRVETDFESCRLPSLPVPRRPRTALPPFRGGYAGLFAYGLAGAFERVPTARRDDFGLEPHRLVLGWYDWVISFDHGSGRAWICSTTEGGKAGARDRLDRVRRSLSDRGPKPSRSALPGVRPLPIERLAALHPLPHHPGVTSNFSPEGFVEAVRRAVAYVHAGDCFQVNLSQRLAAPLREDPLDLYGRLRERSPAPFGGYFDAGEFQVLSASPERFLRVADGAVETRPIKGTRPRGATATEDGGLVRDLLASAKDRAENAMIVDLMRNDLGRVCDYGSVRVTELCTVETFRQVHHLVSEVRGRLKRGLGPFDLLRAAFPGGSVTGAPKVRAMEIVAELEPTARGPYCGSLGYVGDDGSCDSSVLIRTMTAARGWVQFPVGGGIVADSDPHREYAETLHKAAGLLRALEPESADPPAERDRQP